MSDRVPLVVLAGAAGTGKTVLGLRLAQRTGAALLDLDTLTGPLTEELLARGATLSDLRAQRYATLTHTALEVATGGVGVVAAAPWTRELQDGSWYAALQERATRARARLTVLWLHADPREIRARLVRRSLPRDATKLAAWDRWTADFQRPPRVPHTALDGMSDLGALAEAAAAAVRAMA